VQRVLDAGLLLASLGFGRSADIDLRDAARELGETLLELLLVVVALGAFDLGADLGDAALDRFLRAGAATRCCSALPSRERLCYPPAMTSKGADRLRWLRRQFIAAIGSDPLLGQQLVLKGGNALNLVHELGSRSSLDIDYSLVRDPEDLELFGERLFARLRERLSPHGLVVLDPSLQPKPRSSLIDPQGYVAEFKLVRHEDLATHAGDVNTLRKLAQPVDLSGMSGRKFRIEISRHEHCDGRETIEVDGVPCWVYTQPMIVAEKLRALCQQMDGGGRRHPTARARDFYDIWAVVSASGLDLTRPEQIELLRATFSAKSVDLRLLALIREQREFHRVDWPSVAAAVSGGTLRSFDYYFDFVVEQVRRLEASGVVDAPGGV
jgi:hypothetical protein